ncbi:hypothetical protein C2R22_24585 (plasmid) [Salinigranum rubrum]|uniref:Uncharacterized protein n=1 Tax=Salinigranum rubrum TaxID=755307 RepID=A0A2I8VU53_9EURY|nr:hypothetical protein [Salinigranum rubrum]AUV84709.1 hypothetical protein C2R22_24585 [Salinigranum rubrum]
MTQTGDSGLTTEQKEDVKAAAISALGNRLSWFVHGVAGALIATGVQKAGWIPKWVAGNPSHVEYIGFGVFLLVATSLVNHLRQSDRFREIEQAMEDIENAD